jgi:thioredoxin reductase (NADPH)
MVPASSILERRRDQMFPELDPFEIERMRRFGEARSFAQGEAIFTAGQVGPGLVVILSGEVDIVRHEFSHESLIVMHDPGQFMGVFAIGDVRSKSIKRVAAAVGEGAQVVAALHSYLA